MKYNEMKQSLKKKAKALREIKIGMKEAQRVFFFNRYDPDSSVTDEQKRRFINAYNALYKCLGSCDRATRDYRVRHIAYSLFRGKKPEEIENNYSDGKWDDMDADIKKWVNILEVDNPPRTEYTRA